MFLTTLKGIRTDYAGAERKRVYRNEWESLLGRLDALGDEITRALARTTRIEEPRNGDRIVALQRRMMMEESTDACLWQRGEIIKSRLDSIRSDYCDDRRRQIHTYEERADISAGSIHWKRI